jgi:glycosyltransferase involved in cell wall biosynthesis
VRIAVNARRLEGQRLGVGRYIEYLLKHWEHQVEPTEEVDVVLRTPLRADDTWFPSPFRSHVLRPSLTGHAWEQTRLPWKLRGADVLFCPSYTAPLIGPTRSVVAIHSTNEVEAGTHGRLYGMTYAPLYRLSARRAARVIVPSESTLEDIQAHYGIPREKLVVVPQGADEAFTSVRDPERQRRTRVRWLGDDVPYVVFVGKLSQRRNIPVLIRAFAELKRRNGLPHKLLLFGPNHLDLPVRPLAEQLGIADSVVQDDGRVQDHAELVDVYNAADLYVNPSLYEGFSMTLVEALACGTPVVAANRGALGEIAGDAAVLVDEPTPLALADAMHRVLGDAELQTELGAKGVERAESFRWEQTAQRTLDVLREVAEG